MELLKFPKNKKDIFEVVRRAEYAALLVPSPRRSYVAEVCAQAKQYGFASVIATPYDCPEVAKLLEGSGVEAVCLNALNHALDEDFDCRLYSVDAMLEIGVKNIELSVPIGMMRDGKFDQIQSELSAMIDKIHTAGGKASVILEPDCMDKEAMKQVIRAAEGAATDYLRICSGFERVCGSNGGRATLNSIGFVREQSSGKTAIKAGGGWDYAYLEDCAEYIRQGAERVDVGPRLVEQLGKIGYRRDE